MDIAVAQCRTWENQAGTLLANIDGTGPGMLGAGTEELASHFGIRQTLASDAAGVSLGSVKVVAHEPEIILMSVLTHTQTFDAAVVRGALSRALGIARGPDVACSLLTCGKRMSPDSALTNMVSDGERARGSGTLIICVPPWHWERMTGLGMSYGLEVR